MEWTLAIVAAALLAVATVSRRLSGTSLTPAMLFVALGLLAVPLPCLDLTVGLSVFAHGLSASPLARRCARCV